VPDKKIEWMSGSFGTTITGMNSRNWKIRRNETTTMILRRRCHVIPIYQLRLFMADKKIEWMSGLFGTTIAGMHNRSVDKKHLENDDVSSSSLSRCFLSTNLDCTSG